MMCIVHCNTHRYFFSSYSIILSSLQTVFVNMWIMMVTELTSIILFHFSVSLGAECPSGWFDCGEGKCISELWLCDGDKDCTNFKDEHDCENPVIKRECLHSQFECVSDKHCIPEVWHCDGEIDCDDGTDEIECENAHEECNGFHCRNHQCIPVKWRCDEYYDCNDGSDEELCILTNICTDTEFLCSSGSCINSSLLCDGKPDCIDGSDEGSNCGDTCSNMDCSQKCESTPSGPKCSCKHGYTLDKKDNKTCLDVDECLEDGFCSHKCVNDVGGFKCFCEDGYDLINRTCKAKGAGALLIFSTSQEIRGIRLRLRQYYLVRKAIYRASTVDVDPNNQRIYWVEISNRSSIYSADLDGSGLSTVLSHGLLVPEDIAVDYVANNLYITDSGLRQVLACTISGTMCHVLHDKKVEKPHSIALYPAKGFLYWSDWGDHAAGIYRSGMDGSKRISVVSDQVAWPNGIAIDHTTNRLYWADAKLKRIEYITLDGNSRKVILNSAVFHPYSLSVFEDTIYWVDWKTFSLESCNKFTGHKMSVLERKNGKHIMGVHVYHPVLTAKVTNPCWSNDCSHMCLISPTKDFSCACPHGFQLSSDERSCALLKRDSDSLFVNEGSSVFYIRPEAAVGNETVTELPLLLNSAVISRVSYDSKSRFLFVADINAPAIHAINMTSFHSQELVKNHISFPEDLAFDWISNNLYWIDSSKGTVEVISIKGLKRAVLLKNLAKPVALGISPTRGHMFIATIDTQASVSMYDMNGMNKKILHAVQGLPMSLAVHPSKSILYWADPIAGTISYINYLNSNPAKILLSKVDGIMSVVASEDYIYWTARNRELYLRKGNVTHILQLPGQEKGSVSRKVMHAVRSSDTGKSLCLITNGGCSYLCLTSPNGRTCICPKDMILSGDDMTCVERRCEPEHFRCMNGRCLPADLRCDGSRDCGDGSDEVGCDSHCAGDDFHCKNGRCILKSWRCDHRNDCKDNSDEEDCPETTACAKDKIACTDGECISMLWRCDGEADCADSSDEVNCNETRCDPETQVRCDNGQCVPVSWVCDGTNDCHDGSDEKNCSMKAKCLHHEFTCESDGNCVDELVKCDGREDCEDGSDEMNCSKLHFNCKIGMYGCRDGTCIYHYEVCDGRNDCSDNEDEINCDIKAKCLQHEFTCESDGNCVGELVKCDGREDCGDGSDERNCSKLHFNCKIGMYGCRDGTCINHYEVCDGRNDCSDNEDEINCGIKAKCLQHEFTCESDGNCVDALVKCDGKKDCEDGSDEMNCSIPECEGFFCYTTGHCLPWSKVCDGYQDCEDLSDEGGLCSKACSGDNGRCSQICKKSPQGSKCSCFKGYRLLPDNKTCDDVNECLKPGTCSHFCNNTKGGFKCSCAKGYILRDHSTCKAEGGEASVVYLLGDQIRMIDLVSQAQSVYISVSNADMRGMDYDSSKGTFYWTEWNDRSINSYSPDTHRQDIIVRLAFRPIYVRCDWIEKNLYYTDEKSNIGVCTIDGRFCRTLVQPTTHIDSIDLSPTTGQMFWTVWESQRVEKSGLILRAEMDGSNIVKIISEKTMKPSAITVDHVFKMVYWTDIKLNTIECADFQGLNRMEVIQYDMNYPYAMAVFEDYIYWSDWGSDSIIRCKKFSSENCKKIREKNTKSQVLLVIHKVMQPEGTKRCLKRNCHHLCLATQFNPVCMCEDGFVEKDSVCVSNTPNFIPTPPTTCPTHYCLDDYECVVKGKEYICKCPPQYTGNKCQVNVPVIHHKPYDYSWIVFCIFILMVLGIIVLLVLYCFGNRGVGEKMPFQLQNQEKDDEGPLIRAMKVPVTSYLLDMYRRNRVLKTPRYTPINAQYYDIKKTQSKSCERQNANASFVNIFRKLNTHPIDLFRTRPERTFGFK